MSKLGELIGSIASQKGSELIKPLQKTARVVLAGAARAAGAGADVVNNIMPGAGTAVLSFVDSWTGNAVANTLRTYDNNLYQEIVDLHVGIDILERMLTAARADYDVIASKAASLSDQSLNMEIRNLLAPLGFVNSKEVKNKLIAEEQRDRENIVAARKSYEDSRSQYESDLAAASTKVSQLSDELAAKKVKLEKLQTSDTAQLLNLRKHESSARSASDDRKPTPATEAR